MTTGKKHLKLIKRFYGVYVEPGACPQTLTFHSPTTKKDFVIEEGRYICFIEDSAYLITLEHPDWKKAVQINEATYVVYKNTSRFLEGLIFLNYIECPISYINKLNDLQKYDYYGLLRDRYIDLEKNTIGLYLIKN